MSDTDDIASSLKFSEMSELAASSFHRIWPCTFTFGSSAKVRFKTDAAMVRRLGHELVAKQETALGEL